MQKKAKKNNMDKSEKFWNKFSKNYEKMARGDKAYAKTIDIIKKHFNSGDSVLDVERRFTWDAD